MSEKSATTAPSPGPVGNASYRRVIEALMPVIDPDLAFSIVDLGLIREVYVLEEGRALRIDMTLTTPMCPYAPELIGQVKETLLALDGIKEVEVNLVWDPPWDPRFDSNEEVKALLGIWD